MKKYIHTIKGKHKKIKKHIENIKHKNLNRVHSAYFVLLKTPKAIRFSLASFLIIIGLVSLLNPLLPGWLFLGLGIGVFSPVIYYKLIGKHVRSHMFNQIVDTYKNRIRYVFVKNNHGR